MDEAVDDSDRHCLVREDRAPLPNGWLAVISRDRRSYRALISSKSTLVSAWSFGRVGVEIRAPRLDDGLVQQPGFGELVQRIVNGRQDTRIPEVTASPCNCSAMTWRSPMPESAEASSQLTHRWRKEDSNSQSHLNKKLSEGARSVPPASGDPPASLTPSGGQDSRRCSPFSTASPPVLPRSTPGSRLGSADPGCILKIFLSPKRRAERGSDGG